MSPDFAANWSSVIEIGETKDLGKYLGVPLLHKRVGKSYFRKLVEKVNTRANTWQAKKVSLARRISLNKTLLSAIPIFMMQSMRLPKGVCEDLNKVKRQIMWGNTNERRALALVGWDRVCQPKERWGLGLRKMNDMNDALILKIVRGLLSNNSDLWVRVLIAKY